MNPERDPAPADQTCLRDFRDILLQRRHFLSEDVQALEAEACNERTGATGEGFHPAEQATDNAEQDMSLARLESQSREIREIDTALERLSEGSFGVCLECRRPIPVERLMAIPYARLCTNCQVTEETGGEAP